MLSLQASGIKAGLSGIRLLLREAGNPERQFPAVHVAGTNGKGSTSAMIAAALTSAGFRTGLYTSPHLLHFSERIRIDGRRIPAARISEGARRLRPAIRASKATFFEATTAIAFRYFAAEEVDIAVIETGLGGRLDSTNVVEPLVTVITTIGLEHREYLGNTIGKIAFEKAGIIKPGVPCVVGDIGESALGVIRRRARSAGSSLHRAGSIVSLAGVRMDLEGFTADARTGRVMLKELRVAAAGSYQPANARLALAALSVLGRTRRRFAVSAEAVRAGFGSLRELTGFSGRLQVLRRRPLIIADVAHNPDGAAALVGALRQIHSGKFRIVFGVVRDKDYRPMIARLAGIARAFHFTAAGTDRARNPRELSDYAHAERIPARLCGSVTAGIRDAIGENVHGEPILVTGSHFVVGEAMERLHVGV